MTKELKELSKTDYGKDIPDILKKLKVLTSNCVMSHYGSTCLELRILDRIDDMFTEMLSDKGYELYDELLFDTELIQKTIRKEKEEAMKEKEEWQEKGLGVDKFPEHTYNAYHALYQEVTKNAKEGEYVMDEGVWAVLTFYHETGIVPENENDDEKHYELFKHGIDILESR